jgi:hypothetical protein
VASAGGDDDPGDRHTYGKESAGQYQDDLAARINEPAFQRRAGVGICHKLNLIRKPGAATA